MFHVLVVEDPQVDLLYPVTTGRPAFAIHVGTYRLIDLLPRLGGPVSAVVRPHLQGLVRNDYRQLSAFAPTHDWTLVVNARMVPSLTQLQLLQQWVGGTQARVSRAGNRLLAAWLPTPQVHRWLAPHVNQDFSEALMRDVSGIAETASTFELLDYPHDIIRFNGQCFTDSLSDRIARGNFREIADGVFVAEGAKISEFVVTNSRTGPIVIERDTVIGPFCFLRGPVYVGPNSRINEHASLKDGVYVGHTTKIGGEVEGSIIEDYSNKQHHGFLGHSYLGSWINLGAGTCNSDLKNTYGEVKMDYWGQKVPTGLQFVGCFMGDYAKTAINTSIFTGKTIGVCSMVYGFVTTNVPSFVNYARSFGQVTESPAAVMAATQRRMFLRRNVEQRELDIQLLNDMYELTRRERQMSEEPLSL